jgi:hypothetical protein
MDAFSANYIKPRISNTNNKNASIVTNKRQAQMIFTGYQKHLQAVTQKVTQRQAIVFNGADGLAVKNLKEGDTWTNPETLNAIQKTIY